MDKKVVGIILAVVVVAAGALAMVNRSNDAASPRAVVSEPTPQPVVPTDVDTSGAAGIMEENKDDGSMMEDTSSGDAMVKPQTVTVQVTDSGFDKTALAIKEGDTVTFVNNSSSKVWPASDVHPTHTVCPGFDAKKGLATGESYSYTFTEAMVCPFHDHLNASQKGTITVTE